MRRSFEEMSKPIRQLLRSKLVLRLTGWWVARLINSYQRTLRIYVAWEDPQRHPGLATVGCIYSAWHENILLMTYIGAFHDIRVLVSESQDGEYISSVIGNMGYRTIRGSSSRGAVRAVRQLVKQNAKTLLAFTPDGPRGPRRAFQAGAVYVASRTGLPIIPVGFAYDNAWRATSWDRFVVAKPFSRAACYGGHPFFVPPNADAKTLSQYQRMADEAMHTVTSGAQQLLTHGLRQGRVRRAGPGRHIPERPADILSAVSPEPPRRIAG
jgi:lysophospholipid acyltransferase (LPLAT)-like uncharacterized protein